MKLFYTKQILLLILLSGSLGLCANTAADNSLEYVTIAILAKDKAHTLPLYLDCLEKQTWPTQKTYLYIRTNNNTDQTVQILRNWIARVGNKYAKIYFNDAEVAEPVQQYGQHEWNCTRLKVLGTIRQESINWAYKNKSHYFVADCDNFICPTTIEDMLKTNLPIIAPILHCPERTYYSNYHFAVDHNGYFASDPLYFKILAQEIRGIIEVPVVHCTYLIRQEVVNQLSYDDESYRYEYVIFSHSARQRNIPQYIDNRRFYGYLTFAESAEEFAQQTPMMTEYLL